MLGLSLVLSLMKRYDADLPPNLYSNRPYNGVKQAIDSLKSIKDLDKMYFYKTDISNYYNSIPTDLLLDDLKKNLNDSKLYSLFYNLLSTDTAMENDALIHEERGAIAGTPTSSFLSNFYLRDVDKSFLDKDCTYIRYCDDILIVANSKAKLLEFKKELKQQIESKGLHINDSKDQVISPGQPFDYLGLTITGNVFDITDSMFRKVKHRIRRNAKDIRSEYELDLKEGFSIDEALLEMTRRMNRYFFGLSSALYSFTKWYFPMINTSDTLCKIDEYYKEYLRFIVSGRFNKKNYDLVSEGSLKRHGFRSLEIAYKNYLNPKQAAVKQSSPDYINNNHSLKTNIVNPDNTSRSYKISTLEELELMELIEETHIDSLKDSSQEDYRY